MLIPTVTDSGGMCWGFAHTLLLKAQTVQARYWVDNEVKLYRCIADQRQDLKADENMEVTLSHKVCNIHVHRS